MRKTRKLAIFFFKFAILSGFYRVFYFFCEMNRFYRAFFQGIERFSEISFGFLWIYSGFLVNSLGNEVPTRFSWDGSAVAWGSKYFIFAELAILSAIFASLRYFSRFPGKFSYPVPINNENREIQREIALGFFVILRFLNVLLFGYIFWVMIGEGSRENPQRLGGLFWVLVGLLGVSSFVYKYFAKYINNRNNGGKREKIE